MVDNYGYIDDFFKSTPGTDQIKEFEHRIESDPSFAEDVAFYLSAMQAAKGMLHEEKKAGFREIYRKTIPAESVKVFKLPKRFWYYVAAAAVIVGIVISRLIFFQPATVAKLAERYIQEEFIHLGVEMGGREDSMQIGIHLFNDGKLPEALAQFENILKSDTSNFDAKKYCGIVSLKLGQYSKALEYFRQIASEPGYYINPGVFYQALTLMKRNRPGDKQEAKRLLEEVVKKDLQGREEAEDWLKNW